MKSYKQNHFYMRIALVLLFCFTISGLIAQESEKKNYRAQKINNSEFNIDGNFVETQWQQAVWENEFLQFEPYQGKSPYQKTEFALLYDEDNLYVGIKSYDLNPDSISFRMSRRDIHDGDMAGIIFDTYNDKRTGFSFIVSAAGVKADFMMTNDGENEDPTWDPIWWVKTRKTEAGWNAEIRIPLSQLRFKEGDEQLWGVQILRYIFRKDELSTWQSMYKDKPGFVSQFGTLNGIKDIKPKNTFDVTPYMVARTERFEKEPENPFRSTGKKNSLNAGLDAKIGLTNYLTLDLTINPDFGQVEADPSEVNLTTYETFFPEKRPFFIEGKSILSYSLQFGDGDLASENLFYSRRIGRTPQYYPDVNDDEYVDAPEFTSILGAAKITGKSPDGWSVGVLESVTAEEFAEIKGIGDGRTQTVEPLTNYFVSRLQKDFNDGNTYIGGMVTAVNRSINDGELEFLHKSAYTGGLDLVHKWNDKNWMLDAGIYASQVNGTPEAITRTQTSMIRNYQRPDADYIEVDSSLTTLNGLGGKFAVAKVGGKFNFGTIFASKTPGLELNDIGYAQQVDQNLEVIWTNYHFNEPFSIFREMHLHANQFAIMDFGGNLNAMGGNIGGNGQFTNYWHSFVSLNFNGEELNNNELRGGPSLLLPGEKNLFVGIITNGQKKLSFELEGGLTLSNEKDFKKMTRAELAINYRPLKSLSFEITPGYSKYFNNLMYVNQADFGTDKRYIMAHIDRNTVNMSIRINYNITPDMTIQYWGQPFIATGEYNDYKYITNSKAEYLDDRYQNYAPEQISYNESQERYFIDENTDGLADYSFDKPDFNFKEFLSNFVFRWEYQPGSTIYLVWSQTRNHSINDGNFEFSNNINDLFTEGANNIFLLKFSYRFGR